LRYNQTIALQGATTQTGTGITFPASQNASSNANTLDDYEEALFNRYLNSEAQLLVLFITVNEALTQKLEIPVTIQIGIYLQSSGSATGAMTIDGLPFVSVSQSFGSYGGELFVGQSGFGSVTGVAFALVNENSTTIYGYAQNNGVESQLTKTNIATYFQFKTTYQAA